MLRALMWLNLYGLKQAKNTENANEENLPKNGNTPDPWLVHFFRSDKNLHEPTTVLKSLVTKNA